MSVSNLNNRLVIKKDRCKGCTLCTEVCPQGILSISEEKNEHGYRFVEAADAKECIACGFCALICPDLVFEIYKAKSRDKGEG